MKISKHTGLWSWMIASILASCNHHKNAVQSRGAIVLGDSATIITETDSQYLKDMVVDFHPTLSAEQPAQPLPNTLSAPDTTTLPPETASAAPAPPAGSGLKVPFKEVTFFIPDIATRTYTNQDPQTANGVSYQLISGKLQGNTLQLTSPYKISRVAMRYQIIMVLKNSLGKLPLPALGFTSEWINMAGKNNSYPIVLQEKQMQNALPNVQELRTAVQKAVRRMNRKTAQEWLNSVQTMRTVQVQDVDMHPRYLVLMAEGKDASGQVFNKQLRIDLQ